MWTKRLQATLSFFVHSTENEDLILNSIQRMLRVDRDDLAKRSMKGHYDNVIIVYSGNFRGPKAEALLLTVVKGLESSSRSYIARNVDQFVDQQGRLYLRLDKQELVQGRLVIGSRDPVRITFKAPRFKKLEAVSRFREIFGG